MTALLSIEGKKTDPTAWTPFIKQYIADSYAESPDQYGDDCTTIDQLRSQSVNLPSHPNVLTRLQQYYAQLSQIMTKFPLDIGIQFCWYPINGSGSNSVGHKNGYFEKACVLFSIASMYSELGCSESKDSAEGARQSCIYFQNAAGCFQHLRDVVTQEIRVPPPPDLDPKVLTFFSTLMLAQAQECSWKKALIENVRNGAIARLAIKISDFYLTVADLATDDAVAPYIPPSWPLHMRTKANYYEAVAQHRKGIECTQNGKFGEHITRLQLADAALRKAQQDMSSSQSFWTSTPIINDALQRSVNDLQELIAEQLASAIRDNDTVYMDVIPAASQVTAILKFEIVKPVTPIIVTHPLNEMDLSGEDPKRLKPLFSKLVPFAVHQAISVYVDRKDLILKIDIMKKIKELDDECNSTLQTLGLPSSLEALVQPTGLPDSILAKAEEIQHEGGCEALNKMFENVEMLSTKNAALIDEAVNELGKEHDEDERLRRRFQLEWIRPTSISLTSHLLEKGDKLSETLENARNADKIVKEKLNNWSRLIDLLSLPEKAIEQSIPSGTTTSSHGDVGDDVIKCLKDLVDECNENIRDRQRILDEAQSIHEQDDISPLVLRRASELSAGSSTVKIETSQFDPLFTTELGKYSDLLSQVKKHSQNQWILLNKIKDANNEFVAKRRGNMEVSRREKALQNLEQAYLKFKEIRTNLVEGIKFHSQFSKALVKYRDICVDFVMARQIEAVDLSSLLISDVTSIANASVQNGSLLPKACGHTIMTRTLKLKARYVPYHSSFFMKVITALALAFAFTATTVNAGPIGLVDQISNFGFNKGDELRLIQYGDDQPARWMKESEILEMFRLGIKYMDITDYQNAYDDVVIESSWKPFIPAKARYADEVQPYIGNLTTTTMEIALKKLTSFKNRYYKSKWGAESCRWLISAIRDIAEEADGVSVKEFEHSWDQFSIIARFEGSNSDLDNELVIVGAHQDSVNLWLPSFGTAPGADDDGSGTVTILEAFRSLVENGFKPERPVEFHWYSAEEAGLLGSQAVAAEYSKQGKQVVAMLQNDMTGFIGSGGEQIGIVADHVNPELTEFLKTLVETYAAIPYVNTKCGYACSDHASWAKHGYPSAFTIESAFEDSNKAIHTTGDVISRLSFDHMKEFAKVATGFAVELSHERSE